MYLVRPLSARVASVCDGQLTPAKNAARLPTPGGRGLRRQSSQLLLSSAALLRAGPPLSSAGSGQYWYSIVS